MRVILTLLAVYGICITVMVTIAVWSNPIHRAVLCMAWGLIVFLCFGAGLISLYFKNPVSNAVSRIPLNCKFRFVLFATQRQAPSLVELALSGSFTFCLNYPCCRNRKLSSSCKNTFPPNPVIPCLSC